MHINKRIPTIGVIFVLSGTGIWYGCFYRNYEPIYKDPLIIEYGTTDIQKEDILENTPENKHIAITDIKQLDPMEPKPQQVQIETKKMQRSKTDDINIEVRDTKAPIIELVQDQVQLQPGEDFKEEDNIISIHDPVDGRIQDIQRGCLDEFHAFLRNRMIKLNCVYIGSDLNVQVAGDYEVKIVSYDKQGNMSLRSYFVRVEEQNTHARMQIVEEDNVRTKEDWSKDSNQIIGSSTKEAYYDPAMSPSWIPLDLLVSDLSLTYVTYAEALQQFNQIPIQDQQNWHIQKISNLIDNQGNVFHCYVLFNMEKTFPQQDIPKPDDDIITNTTLKI